MGDVLDTLARDAKATIESGYYEAAKLTKTGNISLKNAILESQASAIITEIKAASPSKGTIRTDVKAGKIAKEMQKGGAIAISVLTEPLHFNGSIEALTEARKAVKLPILMKDIVVSPIQISSASRMGANAVLLIKSIFDRGYGQKNLEEMIAGAQLLGLEVLLETHTSSEFVSAMKTDADLIGINNRDLGTFKVDLNTTKNILAKNGTRSKFVISESGISSPEDIRFLKESGASAFLVGSAIMSNENIEEKVRELVNS